MHDRMVICGVKASANSKNKNKKKWNACVCLESAARERERGSSADGADARPAWLWPTGEVHSNNKKGCFTGIWRFIRVK